MTSGHHHTKPNGNRQPKHHEEVHGHQPISNRDSQTIPYGSRQAPHRGHKKQPMSQTRRRNVENVVGRDTGLEDVGTNVQGEENVRAKAPRFSSSALKQPTSSFLPDLLSFRSLVVLSGSPLTSIVLSKPVYKLALTSAQSLMK